MIIIKKVLVPDGEVVSDSDPEKVQESGFGMLDALRQLVYWLANGASAEIYADHIDMRWWVMGETRFLIIRGSFHQMKPLLRAAFAFGFRRDDNDRENGRFLRVDYWESFGPLIGECSAYKIANISRSRTLKELIHGSVARAKFAFLIGSGIRKIRDLEIGLKFFSLNELVEAVKLFKNKRLPLRKILGAKVPRKNPPSRQIGRMGAVSGFGP